MIIAHSEMRLSSQHQSVERRETHETLRQWVGPRRPDFEGQAGAAAAAPSVTDSLRLSAQALASQPVRAQVPDDTQTTCIDQLKVDLLVAMVEAFTGKKLNLARPEDFAARMSEAQTNAQRFADEFNGLRASAEGPGAAGFGIEYDAYEFHYEAESMSFAAQGVVQTTDGQTIEIAVELNMSREFMREQRISLRLGDAQVRDPLVLNFNGAAAELTSTRFSFDIDSNGRSRQIAFVGPNSGFLALDRNGDGTINDGSELFGPRTGSGFAELAAHDQDGNGWIDANDDIYQHLRIWSKDAQGQDRLEALGERGVGAIYLGNIDSPFAIKDASNALLGQVRSSSVFLGESGTVGTVQHIDLAV